MLHLFRLVTCLMAIVLLPSCATINHPSDSNTSSTRIDAQFSSWNDYTNVDESITQQIQQADSMMKFEQWDEAQNKLERVLRTDIYNAQTWSRLSWLALRKANHKKAINLARRSNSNTKSITLTVLNLNFIRDAYKLLDRTDKVKSIDAMLKKIQESQ